MQASNFSPELAAQAAARLINESKDVKGFSARASTLFNAEDYVEFQKIISQIDQNEKFSATQSVGSKVTWDRGSIQIQSDRTFNFQGHVFKPVQKRKFLAYFKEALDRVKSPEVSQNCLWINCANAIGLQMLMQMSNAMRVLTVGAAVTVKVVQGYLTAEAYQYFKSGVTCEDKNFVRREKTRNQYLVASSQSRFLSPEIAGQILGKSIVRCSDQLAKELTDAFEAGAEDSKPPLTFEKAAP